MANSALQYTAFGVNGLKHGNTSEFQILGRFLYEGLQNRYIPQHQAGHCFATCYTSTLEEVSHHAGCTCVHGCHVRPVASAASPPGVRG